MDEEYDDIPVTEAEPERASAPAAPSFDPDRFAASIAEGVAKSLGPMFERLAPQREPERPRSLGDAFKDRVRESLGLDGDVADRYARAAAYSALGDEEWGSDPAVKRAIAAQTGDARLIEALAEVRRENRALHERMNARESAEKQQAERAEQRARLEALAEKGELRKLAPNTFSGPLTPAHRKLLQEFDVDTLAKVLPVVDELMATQRPRSRRLGASPGGTGREKPQPFRVVPDSEWDEDFQRRITGEEHN
jgi:hypothetical protein